MAGTSTRLKSRGSPLPNGHAFGLAFLALNPGDR